MSEKDSIQGKSTPKKSFSVRYVDSKLKINIEEQQRIADALKKLFAEDRAEALKEIESRRVPGQKRPL